MHLLGTEESRGEEEKERRGEKRSREETGREGAVDSLWWFSMSFLCLSTITFCHIRAVWARVQQVNYPACLPASRAWLLTNITS